MKDDSIHSMGLNSLAELFGSSTRTVQGYVRAGMPCKVKGSKSLAWEFDGRDCVAWLISKKLSEQKPGRTGEDGEEKNSVKADLEEAKLVKLKADGEAAKLRLARERGETMDANAVTVALAKLGNIIRSDLEAIPVSLSVRIAAEGDIDACRRMMTEEVEAVLYSVADEFDRIAANDLTEFEDTEDEYLNSPEGEGGGDVDS